MIVLDTNVLSALMQVAPDQLVLEWLDRQPAESVWTTSVTVFEVSFGLKVLPRGRRRSALEAAFAGLLEEDLEGRVLDFDRPAAEAAAAIAADRQGAGRPIEFRDTQIAGILTARRAQFATRNVKHFADLAVSVINPWESARLSKP